MALKHLETLNPSKATGLYNLPAKFIRDVAKHLAPPFTFIINLSIHHGKVPNELKQHEFLPFTKNKQNKKKTVRLTLVIIDQYKS